MLVVVLLLFVSWMFIYFILQILAIREMVPSAEE